MKLSNILVIAGINGIILTIILSKYLPSSINLLSMVISLFTAIMGIVLEYDNRKKSQLHIEETRVQHSQIIKTIEKKDVELRKRYDKTLELETSNTKLRQLMNRVSLQLKKEHMNTIGLYLFWNKLTYGLVIVVVPIVPPRKR